MSTGISFRPGVRQVPSQANGRTGEDRGEVRRVCERTLRPHEVRDHQRCRHRPQEHDRKRRAHSTHWGHLLSHKG